ncbi:LuxR C-terminal-related transcriptional regulator [Micromonospora sp. NIE79]|uniref:LuxR C-terminal-related transcriptional regulator n=1 Tax=Micromonospora trifolii TaxID=2911208 RepID=A0ABS9N7R2_9ACTN|nr:LuxR C-terminal-related transcriptional regulator [Micromonospora trifolii]MCG5445991.1 LuxR C-terminal-related transcriptional regulator [Micromonospora trifolii]
MAAPHPARASKREIEVLVMLGARQSNADIAGRLHISVRTVENHVSSLLRKYGVADRRALGELAVQVQAGAPVPGRLAGLPLALTTFVGRSAERAHLTETLRDARLVTLVGTGGMGKTRLAGQIAEAAGPFFPSGGAFVDLTAARDGYVAQAVAAALGVSERPQQSLEDAVVERLGESRSLLVLDNCEHVIDAVAPFAERVLADCPGTRILVTSRERLGIRGERAVLLGPLPLESDAERLFIDRATTADPRFAADPAVVAKLCARLDGMPLAIELAAARSASLGETGLLAALDDHLRLVAGGRGRNERHRSLRAVIGWSHDLLDDEEQTLFRRLAVFAGAFDLDAVAAVSSAGSPRGAIADVLGRLADKSLVTVHHRGAAALWRLLQTVRAFAIERLDASGELPEVQARHLRWAANVATELETKLDGDEWYEEFDRLADDLREALAVAPEGPGELPHRLARALAHLAYTRRFLMESLGHYRTAAERAPAPGEAAADLHAAAAVAHAIGDDGQRPFDLLIAAANLAQSAGDRAATATALAQAVTTAKRHPAGFDGEIPYERLRELLDAATSAADGSSNAVVAARLAEAAAWAATSDRHQADLALPEAAVAAARATDDPVLISAALDAVATADLVAGRAADLRRIMDERLALLSAMPRHEPSAAPEIIDTYRMAHLAALGVGDLPGALSIGQRTMDDDLVGSSYHSAALLLTPLVLSGRFDEALRMAGTAWEGWRRAGRPRTGTMSPPMAAVALVHGLRGDDEGYALWRSRAIDVIGELPPHPTFLTMVDARLALHAGRLEDALVLVRLAFNGTRSWSPPYAQAVGAELAVVAGLSDARDLLSAAERHESAWVSACTARARGRLDGDTTALTDAVAGWERIGARFERACTLLLLPDRVAEGQRDLAALGVGGPAH